MKTTRLNSHRLALMYGFLLLILSVQAFSTNASEHEHSPNHISLFIGHTDFSEHEFFVSRLGALYEFRYSGYTFSPQFHFDYHEGVGSSKVAGLAVGFDF